MGSYSEEVKLAEIINWFTTHRGEELKGEDSNKWEELKILLRGIDRINIREFVDNRLADHMEDLIEMDNKWFQELDWVEQVDFFIEEVTDHFGISVWIRNQFQLKPPFVRQGTKIPENIRKLYAESRRCFVFEQYSAAIVLSRAIIEIVLKKKIGLPDESRRWTAGVVLEKASEKKIINEHAYWIADKVIKNADKILHQGKIAEQQETLNAIDHTKEFLEELFG
jgi:hypothetical protein